MRESTKVWRRPGPETLHGHATGKVTAWGTQSHPCGKEPGDSSTIRAELTGAVDADGSGPPSAVPLGRCEASAAPGDPELGMATFRHLETPCVRHLLTGRRAIATGEWRGSLG